ncbi:MAG: Hsp20/alpha crystallin family protein [bacterium]|nr:Hsp20/alpha crystallin family protein [bacterium]
MLMPSLFHDSFVDDFFDDMFSFPTMEPVFSNVASLNTMMSTDVQDLGDSYQLEIELPGYNKEDIHAELRNGYMTITASKKGENEEKNDDGEYLRRERFTGECSRSFYVGDHVKEEDVKAGFENGILKVTYPKKESTPQIEDKKYIDIA